ncbi:MAG: hypothetical protein RL377_133 [Bacteroidota bacterium]|jgi:hypothetical protein
MPNLSTDALFILVKSLEKGEKRNFKLYAARNSASADLKIVQLFDALDKMKDYDEEELLRKNESIQKQQLSNLKAHLYDQILASLRIVKQSENIDLQIHEQLDHAKILYNKGLYIQSLRLLDKIKTLTKQNNQVTYLLQVLFLEKKIESLHITRSMQDRAKQLSDEIDDANKRIHLIAKTSNLSLQLYSWYIQHGHARDEEDRITLDNLMQDPILEEVKTATGFYERLYRYQCHCWYGFITQDFLMHYRYAQKWVDLFEKEEGMKQIESAQYIKGLHNLISAHFDLKNFDKFKETICLLEQFSETPIVLNNKNNLIQSFVYLYIAKINQHFLEGTFSEGLNMIPAMEEKLKEVELYIDSHRVLVFYYKIASLYFGAGNPEKSIDYLNRIINWKVNLRDDLQCYARLLHLIAHYEMGNMEVVAYLSKSVFRFMSKMKNLGAVEEVLFNFIKTSIQSGSEASFETLLEKLQPLEKNKLESRAFMYLDIISWLESKIQNTAVQTIIQEKFEIAKKQRS